MLVAASSWLEGGKRVRRLTLAPERRSLLSAMVAILLCLSAMLVASSSDRTDTVARESPNDNGPIPAWPFALTVHDPILVASNAEFTYANGVILGSGTEPDPYIIADWEINASTAHGIIIQGTDAHFVVRNCHIHDGRTTHNHGVLLSSCVNGTLENLTCSNNSIGISLQSSGNNRLLSNKISNSALEGIRLNSSSDNNTIIDNNGGIRLYSSSNNTITNNNCADRGIGLLDSSSNNTLIGNNCLRAGINLAFSSNNTLSGNDCSEVDGDIGAYGIRLYSSSSNILVNNTCNLSTLCGLSLSTSSNNNTLIGNDISSNFGYGISVSSSNDNRIWNNTFMNNWIQASDTGTNNRWNSTDGYGNYWSDWTTPDVDPPFGIVDLPYNISGSAGAKDYYPLTNTPTAPMPEFAIMPLVVMVLLVATILTGRARRRKAQ